MSEYIKMWLTIIENMNNDNTYKLAWGRSILECVSEIEYISDHNVITFEQIAYKILKYYWNQTFFFHLKQSPMKKPVILQETEKCIAYYIGVVDSTNPVWFDKAEVILKQNERFYRKVLNKIAITLKSDVSWRFKYCLGQNFELYTLDKQNREIILSEKSTKELKEYSFILSQLLNYKWAQLLEKFNNCPRIASKIRGISDTKLKRNNLKKFKNILLSQMDNDKIVDFYTGRILKENEISVDHVIPWSFMYSDDIWNLVITSKASNSQKGAALPTKQVIEKLKERNIKLLSCVTEENIIAELSSAIENHYIDKFYQSFKL